MCINWSPLLGCAEETSGAIRIRESCGEPKSAQLYRADLRNCIYGAAVRKKEASGQQRVFESSLELSGLCAAASVRGRGFWCRCFAGKGTPEGKIRKAGAAEISS